MTPREVLEEFILGELHIEDFQLWIYQNESLSSFFGASRYNDLLNEVYSQQNAGPIRRELSYEFEQRWPGRLQLVSIRKCCASILGGAVDLKAAVGFLARSRYDLDWIPAIFAGIDSEIDAVPGESVRHLWDEEAWLNLQLPLRDYIPLIERETRKLLTEVESRIANLKSSELAPANIAFAQSPPGIGRKRPSLPGQLPGDRASAVPLQLPQMLPVGWEEEEQSGKIHCRHEGSRVTSLVSSEEQ